MKGEKNEDQKIIRSLECIDMKNSGTFPTLAGEFGTIIAPNTLFQVL